MTDAEDDGRAATDARRPRLFLADVVLGLAASLVWAASTFVRLGEDRSAATALVALGCTASSTIPLVAFSRLVGWKISINASVDAAALVVLAPIALFASVLQTHTHHRALGAVTFAAGATFMVAVAFPITRKILREASAGGRFWRLLRGTVWGVSCVSVAWVLWTLVGSRDRSQSAVVDGALGLVAVALSASVRRAPVWSPLVRVAPALLAVVLGAGAVAVWKNTASFAILCERAPVTAGIPGVFACH